MEEVIQPATTKLQPSSLCYLDLQPHPLRSPLNMATPVQSDSPASPEHAQLTPELDGEAGQHHISPSFDYHEERRMHLQDEIWLSHHLPRLPPPALGESVSSLASSFEATRQGRQRTAPGDISLGGTSVDASPSAFHPRPNVAPDADQLRRLAQPWKNPDEEGDMKYQNVSAAQAFPGSSMMSPSGPEDGDLDPAATLIHRTELDDQERLDLEEEARERMISGIQGDLAGLSLGLPGGQGANQGPNAVPPHEPGESLFYHHLSTFEPCYRLCLFILCLLLPDMGGNPFSSISLTGDARSAQCIAADQLVLPPFILYLTFFTSNTFMITRAMSLESYKPPRLVSLDLNVRLNHARPSIFPNWSTKPLHPSFQSCPRCPITTLSPPDL